MTAVIKGWLSGYKDNGKGAVSLDSVKIDDSDNATIEFLRQYNELYTKGTKEAIYSFLETQGDGFTRFGPVAYILRNQLFARTIKPKEDKDKKPVEIVDGLKEGWEFTYYPNSNQKRSEALWQKGQLQVPGQLGVSDLYREWRRDGTRMDSWNTLEVERTISWMVKSSAITTMDKCLISSLGESRRSLGKTRPGMPTDSQHP